MEKIASNIIGNTSVAFVDNLPSESQPSVLSLEWNTKQGAERKIMHHEGWNNVTIFDGDSFVEIEMSRLIAFAKMLEATTR